MPVHRSLGNNVAGERIANYLIMHGFFRLSSIVMALVVGSFAYGDNLCDQNLSGPPNSQLSMAAIHYARRIPITATPKMAQDFWQKTFPYIRGLAENSGVRVRDLYQEYISMNQILMEDLGGSRDDYKLFLLGSHKALVGADLLEKMSPSAKLKRNSFEAARAVYWATIILMEDLVAYEENKKFKYASLNPYAPLTIETVKTLFSKLEEYGFDSVIEANEAEMLEQKDHNAKQKLFREQGHIGSAIPETDRAPEETVVSLPTPVEITTKMMSENDLGDDDTRNLDFAHLVRSQAPLRANHQYEFLNTRGENYQLILSQNLVESSMGAEKWAIYKLLRALLTGRGGISGLKPLYDIGPNFVEIKTVMHGHKRIFGCLEGRNLRLVELVEIPATREAYFKRIRRDYCNRNL